MRDPRLEKHRAGAPASGRQGRRPLAGLFLVTILVSSATAQYPVIEAEKAFDDAGVVGGEKRHMMVASLGYCIGNGWGRGPGDSAAWEVDVPKPIRNGVLAIRCSTTHRVKKGKGPRLVVSVGREGDEVEEIGAADLVPSRLLEEFRTVTVKVGRLAKGRHRVAVRLETPGEVWLDCLSLCPKEKLPAEFTRRLVHENVSGGGHFHLIFSPHVSKKTERSAKQYFKKLERFYAFLKKQLGGEPQGKVVTCGISARRDSAGGAAHAMGTIFMIDEEGALAKESGNMMHEMTHTFQTDPANNGPMPRWVREGEAYTTCMIGDKELFRKNPLRVHGTAYDDPTPIRRVAFDEYGYNVVPMYGSGFEPEGRPYYRIWNCVFHHAYVHDPEFLSRFHARIRDRMKAGPFSETPMRHATALAGAYVDLMAGDDMTLRRHFDDWGLPVSPDLLPVLGAPVLDVVCAWKRPPQGAAVPWQPGHDHVKEKTKGFGYRQQGAISWRGGDDHQWVINDGRYSPRPTRLIIVVPKGFTGHVVLRFEGDNREHRVTVENHRKVTIGDAFLVVPVDEQASRDGRIDLLLDKTRGLNGALLGFTVHRAAKPLDQPKLQIACAAAVKPSDGNRDWRRDGDRVVAARGFDYEVPAGKQWTDGRARQWFWHDRRFGNVPLDVTIRVPKKHDGFLKIRPDTGRFHRFTLDHRRSYVTRLEREIIVPLDEELTADGEVHLRVRRFGGGNAALVDLEVY